MIMKNVKKKITLLIVSLILIMTVVVLIFNVLLESAFVKDDSYDTLYTIKSQKGIVEIRHDYSALSKDAIVLLKDGVSIDSYDYFNYKIKSILVVDDTITVSVFNDSTQNADTISIAF